ncbi:unnamed protein product [Meganyctiphanes norvegica]|uniref:Uncharacterized protein n=1 Tax=Meganyctiphanes norvegica TaxID=48144 RepID=A0AAV2S860_MEGNR
MVSEKDELTRNVASVQDELTSSVNFLKDHIEDMETQASKDQNRIQQLEGELYGSRHEGMALITELEDLKNIKAALEKELKQTKDALNKEQLKKSDAGKTLKKVQGK